MSHAPGCRPAESPATGCSLASMTTATGAASSKATRSSKASTSCCWPGWAASNRRWPAKCAAYIVEKQLPDGGWAMYPGGQLEISGSVKAYFALKLTGHDPQRRLHAAGPRRRFATPAARTRSTASRGSTWPCSARFPTTSARRCRRSWCCCRPGRRSTSTGCRPGRGRSSCRCRSCGPIGRSARLPPERGIRELFLREPARLAAAALPRPGATSTAGSPGSSSSAGPIAALKWLEARRWRPLRRRALAAAERWMTTRFAHSDGLGAIFPPIIWSVIALKCLGYDDDSAELRYNFDQLAGADDRRSSTRPACSRACRRCGTRRIALRALAASGLSRRRSGRDRGRRLAARQGSHAAAATGPTHVDAPPGGWFFEYHNEFYPDVDDTAMVMIALQELQEQESGVRSQRSADQKSASATPRSRRSRSPPRPDRRLRAGPAVAAGHAEPRRRLGRVRRDNDARVPLPRAVRRSQRDDRSQHARPHRPGARSARPLWRAQPDDPAVDRGVDYLAPHAGARRQLVRPLGRQLHLRHLAGAGRPGRRRRADRRSGDRSAAPTGCSPISKPAAAGANRPTATSSPSCAARARSPPRKPPGPCWA